MQNIKHPFLGLSSSAYEKITLSNVIVVHMNNAKIITYANIAMNENTKNPCIII